MCKILYLLEWKHYYILSDKNKSMYDNGTGFLLLQKKKFNIILVFLINVQHIAKDANKCSIHIH